MRAFSDERPEKPIPVSSENSEADVPAGREPGKSRVYVSLHRGQLRFVRAATAAESTSSVQTLGPPRGFASEA